MGVDIAMISTKYGYGEETSKCEQAYKIADGG